jgi:large subunit ribosomal protein L16
MMQPKKTKFRKAHKGRIHGVATSGATLSFGQFGLKAMAPVRMGSGKGTPELWVARVKPGRVIFEIDGVTVQTAKEALSLAAAKLPIKTRFVARIAE